MRLPKIRLDFSLHIGDDEPPDDHYNDAIGTHMETGFITTRDGRIEDVQ